MSASTSTSAAASSKTQTGQKSQASQGPRLSNGAAGGVRKTQNGNTKAEGVRKSPQTSANNGQQAKGKSSPKTKATGQMSEYLRGRGATVEIAALVAQVRADLGGYYSEELVYNTLVANSNNPDATRGALTRASFLLLVALHLVASLERESSIGVRKDASQHFPLFALFNFCPPLSNSAISAS